MRPTRELRFVGVGPGYIVESPRHSLHRSVFRADDQPDGVEDQRCRPRRVVPARVVTTPIFEKEPLTVAAERPRDREYLRGRNVGGVVSVRADTAIDGLDRNGAPFVEAGDACAWC